ncbi:hypothetical protein MIND_01114900 [Mycena indigotica]|uniref:Secreted protein n=1 Tax=Mycena indigotica TaxID=2126181 RepID=A0A8H6S8T0_9AGAR|nr:uncharacterized protein MIND_01114900 [Mycena indigotica]KAF7293380.1 hypothetical protein MIND_01114900 [Mycena indigotica]
MPSTSTLAFWSICARAWLPAFLFRPRAMIVVGVPNHTYRRGDDGEASPLQPERTDSFGRFAFVGSGTHSHCPYACSFVISVTTSRLLVPSKCKRTRQTLPSWLAQHLRKAAQTLPSTHSSALSCLQAARPPWRANNARRQGWRPSQRLCSFADGACFPSPLHALGGQDQPALPSLVLSFYFWRRRHVTLRKSHTPPNITPPSVSSVVHLHAPIMRLLLSIRASKTSSFATKSFPPQRNSDYTFVDTAAITASSTSPTHLNYNPLLAFHPFPVLPAHFCAVGMQSVLTSQNGKSRANALTERQAHISQNPAAGALWSASPCTTYLAPTTQFLLSRHSRGKVAAEHIFFCSHMGGMGDVSSSNGDMSVGEDEWSDGQGSGEPGSSG